MGDANPAIGTKLKTALPPRDTHSMNSSKPTTLQNYRNFACELFQLSMSLTDRNFSEAPSHFSRVMDSALLLIEANESSQETQTILLDASQQHATQAMLGREFPSREPPTLEISSEEATPSLPTYPPNVIPAVVVMKEEPSNIMTHRSQEEKTIQITPKIFGRNLPPFASLPADFYGDVSHPPSIEIEEDLGLEVEDSLEAEAEAEAEAAEAEEEAEEEVEEAEEVEGEEEVVEEEVEAEVEEAEGPEAEEEVEEAEAEEEVVEEAEEEVVEEAEAEEEEEEEMELVKLGRTKKSWYHCGAKSRLLYAYVDDETAGECKGKYENGKIVPL